MGHLVQLDGLLNSLQAVRNLLICVVITVEIELVGCHMVAPMVSDAASAVEVSVWAVMLMGMAYLTMSSCRACGSVCCLSNIIIDMRCAWGV